MRARGVQCGKCHAPVPAEFFNRGTFSPCPACAAMLQVEVFPSFNRPPPAVVATEAVLTGEAGCFFHPEKKAVVPCESCGRFLCQLCDCEIGGQHLCPNCLETGMKKGRIKSLENRRMLYDRIALAIALVPVPCFYYMTFFTAPLAIFVANRYWNAPRSIPPRSRALSVIAIVLALFEIAAWMILLTFVIRGLITQ